MSSVMGDPPYLPFANGKWRMVPGLRSLDLRTWIEIDEHLERELALKETLLQQRYSDVFASLPRSEPGQQETLDLLVAHLLKHFPQYYQQEGDRLHNSATDQTWHFSDFKAAPLDLAGRLVQEDFCLMRSAPEGYVLSAASVCFPSRWLLAEKIGRPMGQIHAPVPGYAEKLRSPVNRFFEQIRSDRPVWRLNWSIVDSPDLFLLQSRNTKPNLNGADAGEKLWIRVERQTLRRLPQSGNILFTIRTYVYSLSLLETNPSAAKGLATAIQQVSPEMQHYKTLLPIREALLDYLANITQNFDESQLTS
jgi:dimethylamine monooxygenase subunit A